MNPLSSTRRWLVTPAWFLSAAIWTAAWEGYSATNEVAADEVRIVTVDGGDVVIIRKGDTTGVGVRTTETNQVLNAGDRLRVGRNTRVSLRWSDRSVVRFNELTEIEILPPDSRETLFGLRLLKGLMSFFHRDTPGHIRVLSRGAPAGIKGTEFVMQVETVDNTERTTLYVREGEVHFGYGPTPLVLTNGEAAVAEVGKAPVRIAGFNVNNVLQWCFYYPAVLDLNDLPLTPEERGILGESLAAYREGDLLVALDKYPEARHRSSDAERIYYAALLLSVGQVPRATNALALLSVAGPTERLQRLANALHQLIAAVKFQEYSSALQPQLATEFLAASYYEQSRATGDDALRAALALAKQAATNSPEFSFAWARVAELEFSFGRTDRALEALDMSLALALRNAQALALRGFLLADENKTREAIEWFDQAIVVDSSLGNAWLGRGLCRIHRGDARGGREDLLVAAALEPQRAALRSYLGKAYADAGDHRHAAKEIQLAKGLDLNDPTAWLYSALLNQQQNRINKAIRDLERSQELNENRRVYRSRLMLDQDRAVRSANLAAIYRDAGMFDVSVREAARAVNYDYANYSAHLFLANSYNELRDPNLINLRYETPANSEYLVANLLAPVGAGLLSPTISQQEYSRLFEHDGFGVTSSTEYLSRGAWLQSAAQFGAFGNFSYNLEAFYRSDDGQRPNNDVEQRQLSLLLKQQLTPQDAVYFQATHAKLSGGDLFQYYYETNAAQDFRFEEKQEPILSLGYHHEWQPGVHTLFLAARLDDKFSFTNTTQPAILFRQPGGNITAVDGLTMAEDYEGRLEIYTTELQQIWQQREHTTIAGVRFQHGDFKTENLQNQPSGALAFVFADPAALQDINTGYRRLSLYGYHLWQVVEPLQLIGGITYDYMTFPENFRIAPLSEDEESVDKVSPKAGVIWTPSKNTTLRFAYTRALSGPSLDQSFQLEPSQVAGFIQSYRSIIPESVAGANAGAEFETFGLSLEQTFASGTYLGLTGEILNSEVMRMVGAFQGPQNPAQPSGLRNHLDYEERSVLFTLNQLLGNAWSIGARYRLSQAEYTDDFVDVPNGIVYRNFVPHRDEEALLHELSLDALYNHPCGLFGHFQALWYSQDNNRDAANLADDEFWQFNFLAGYRFPRRKAEITLGVLNLTDQDYRLNPLTPYQELPRDRTLVVRLQINF